jgi:hypothetical protein
LHGAVFLPGRDISDISQITSRFVEIIPTSQTIEIDNSSIAHYFGTKNSSDDTLEARHAKNAPTPLFALYRVGWRADEFGHGAIEREHLLGRQEASSDSSILLAGD